MDLLIWLMKLNHKYFVQYQYAQKVMLYTTKIKLSFQKKGYMILFLTLDYDASIHGKWSLKVILRDWRCKHQQLKAWLWWLFCILSNALIVPLLNLDFKRSQLNFAGHTLPTTATRLRPCSGVCKWSSLHITLCHQCGFTKNGSDRLTKPTVFVSQHHKTGGHQCATQLVLQPHWKNCVIHSPGCLQKSSWAWVISFIDNLLHKLEAPISRFDHKHYVTTTVWFTIASTICLQIQWIFYTQLLLSCIGATR